jgi:GAF domain-containing protein
LGRFLFGKGRQLVLGPFQGPLACTRIRFGEGVCGHAYSTKKAVMVPNVDEFPGHIACSSAARSEIVVPLFDRTSSVLAILDVDSDRLDDFSDTDREGLERIAVIAAGCFQ